jgi:hypothetical protein
METGLSVTSNCRMRVSKAGHGNDRVWKAWKAKNPAFHPSHTLVFKQDWGQVSPTYRNRSPNVVAGEKGLTRVGVGQRHHVKNVPGRKTDVNDATWLADLMAHGLIRPRFVPDEPTQQMRDLLRTRKQFVRERCSHTQRIQKTTGGCQH